MAETYDYEEIHGLDGDVHYRVSCGGDRIATTYLEDNAQFIVKELKESERLRNEVYRLQDLNAANEAHANEWIDKLDDNVTRLKLLVQEAFREGFDCGQTGMKNLGHAWADSEARAELEGE